jgi:tRNA(Ser,Leu) C12 N-acetylase TAN1
MFDLNDSVEAWQENFEAEGVYGPFDLDELESHLREEISKLTGRALSEREAFEVACLRMGDTKIVSREFAKVNAGMIFKRRLF